MSLAIGLLVALVSVSSSTVGLGAAGQKLPPRPLNTGGKFYGDKCPGRIPFQYAEELKHGLIGWPAGRGAVLQLAAEAKALFWDPVESVAPLPRSLDSPCSLPDGSPAPDFYSSTMGGPHLMYQFARICFLEPDSPAVMPLCRISRRFLDGMLEWGTDRYGPKSTPLMASLLVIADTPYLPDVHLDSSAWPYPPTNFPRAYNAELNTGGPHRFAYMGSNLLNDQPLYLLMYLVSQITGDPKYARAADSALSYWMRHTAAPDSGLYPWGEHAQYDFRTDAWADPFPASPYRFHELIPMEPAFRDRLWALEPLAFQRYMRAVMASHVVNLGDRQRMVVDRHAALWTTPRPKEGMEWRMLIYPRHVGTWLQLWCFVLSRPPAQLRRQRMLFDQELEGQVVSFLAGLKTSIRVRLCGEVDDWCSVEVFADGERTDGSVVLRDELQYVPTALQYCHLVLPRSSRVAAQIESLFGARYRRRMPRAMGVPA